jgi:Pyruvate/2-oxoacid:ferredoxin oxidoreductase delta subunit
LDLSRISGAESCVTKTVDYSRARKIMSTIFVAPSLPNDDMYKCPGCSRYCPNHYVLEKHRVTMGFHGVCPPDDWWESGMITPAFLLPEVVLDFFEAVISQ